MTALEAYDILNALFDGHLSRNADNILSAMQKHDIPESSLTELEQAGLVVRLPYSQTHFERQAFGEPEVSRIMNLKKQSDGHPEVPEEVHA